MTRTRSHQPALVESWQDLRSQWRAGVQSPHRPTPSGMASTGTGGDYHYANESQFLRQMELFRWYERNDPIINAALSRLTTNVCQRGFTVDPQTGDEPTDKRLAQEWRAWSTDPDRCCVRGRHTFHELAAIVFRSVVRDGDCSVLPLKSRRLQVYESHRLRTPTNTSRNVVHGILLDELRRPVEYWFTRESIGPHQAFDRVGEAVKISAYDNNGNPQVLHIARPSRYSQSRGVSWLAPSVDYAEMSANIQFAKMVQQQVSSNYSLINKRSAEFRPEDDLADKSGKDKTRDDYLQRLHRDVENMSPGMIYDTLPGEELIGFSPNIPNAEFFEHAKLLLTFLAINIDMPVSVLMLDPSDTNFSGWRGAIDQARQSWRAMQQWLISQLHTPVYKWWIRSKIRSEPWLQDKIVEGIDPLIHEWKPPAWPYIEPHKDALADSAIVTSGMSSRRRRMADRGMSYDEEMPAIFSELERELVECHGIASRLNAMNREGESGLPADWREIASARGILAVAAPASLSAIIDDNKGDPE